MIRFIIGFYFNSDIHFEFTILIFNLNQIAFDLN